MRVLLANVKHFYQCRVLWFLYLWVLLFLGTLFCFYLQTCWGPHDIGRSKGMYFTQMGFVCAFSFSVGLILASLQTDVMTKPFSFCLPRHRILCRGLVFLVGPIMSLITLLVWPWDSVPAGLSPLHLLGIGLTAYFVGIIMGMTFISMALGIAMIAMLFLPMGGSLLDSRISKEHALVIASPPLIYALAIAVAGGVWLWLGKADLFRRRCSRPWLSLSESWNPAAREKYRLARVSARTIRVPQPRADGLLLRVTMHSEDRSIAQYVWGALYTWLLPAGPGRSLLVSMGLLSLASGALAWYMPLMGAFFIANVAVSSGLLFGHLPVGYGSQLVVAGGRRERFLTTVVLIVILGAIVTCGVVFAFGAMRLVGAPTIMSSTHSEGSRSYLEAVVTQPTNLRLALLLMALFPLSCFLGIRLCGGKLGMMIVQWTLLALLAMLAMLMRPLLMAIPPTFVVLAFVLSWIVGLYGIHRTIMRSDLGRK